MPAAAVCQAAGAAPPAGALSPALGQAAGRVAVAVAVAGVGGPAGLSLFSHSSCASRGVVSSIGCLQPRVVQSGEAGGEAGLPAGAHPALLRQQHALVVSGGAAQGSFGDRHWLHISRVFQVRSPAVLSPALITLNRHGGPIAIPSGAGHEPCLSPGDGRKVGAFVGAQRVFLPCCTPLLHHPATKRYLGGPLWCVGA